MTVDMIIQISSKLPFMEMIKQNNAYVELLIKHSMVPAISDKGSPPPTVFRQADEKISYAISSQNRYNDEVHETLHGKEKESQIYESIEIQTLVSTQRLPDIDTPESLELKK